MGGHWRYGGPRRASASRKGAATATWAGQMWDDEEDGNDDDDDDDDDDLGCQFAQSLGKIEAVMKFWGLPEPILGIFGIFR